MLLADVAEWPATLTQQSNGCWGKPLMLAHLPCWRSCMPRPALTPSQLRSLIVLAARGRIERPTVELVNTSFEQQECFEKQKLQLYNEEVRQARMARVTRATPTLATLL